MKLLSLKIPDALAAELSTAMQHRGISQSEIIREAVAYYLRMMPNEKRSGSFLELAHDLCGKNSGPVDLSTNSKHLTGYGK